MRGKLFAMSSNEIVPPPGLADDLEAWRDWWFGYLCQPNPDEPGELRYRALAWDIDKYAPFDSSATAVAALQWLFERAGELMPRYDREAVANGLWQIAHSLKLQYGHALWDANAADDAIDGALQAMPRLFSDLFAMQCAPAMSSYPSQTDDELNGICYMWFDLLGLDFIERNGISRRRVAAAVRTMGNVLYIRHVACQESALHGLGHVARYNAALVRSPVNRFLSENKCAAPALRAYAERAREGHVQ